MLGIQDPRLVSRFMKISHLVNTTDIRHRTPELMQQINSTLERILVSDSRGYSDLPLIGDVDKLILELTDTQMRQNRSMVRPNVQNQQDIVFFYHAHFAGTWEHTRSTILGMSSGWYIEAPLDVTYICQYAFTHIGSAGRSPSYPQLEIGTYNFYLMCAYFISRRGRDAHGYVLGDALLGASSGTEMLRIVREYFKIENHQNSKNQSLVERFWGLLRRFGK